MRSWLPELVEALKGGQAAMLVHLAELKGSGPREPGAQMLVTETGLFGTIGGGELEHSAMQTAREWLRTGRCGVLAWSLGPELGQCCGGAVTLGFEVFAPADLAWVQRLASATDDVLFVVRTVEIGATGAIRRDWQVQRDGGGAEFTAQSSEGGLVIRERMNVPRSEVWVFGSGHVGRAVVNALHPLGFALTWIDGRSGHFPQSTPPGVTCLSLAMPELIVDQAPATATFLVMTHSHTLDEAICEAVLRRGEFGFLGLIGSRTKRARFRKRLAATGLPPALLDRLVCPIGLPSIASKVPAAIAASVAADLLIRRERQEHETGMPLAHAV